MTTSILIFVASIVGFCIYFFMKYELTKFDKGGVHLTLSIISLLILICSYVGFIGSIIILSIKAIKAIWYM